MVADVPAFNQQIATFLAAHGFPVAPYTTGGIFTQGLAGPNQLGAALPGQVDYSPAGLRQVAAAAARVGRRGNLNNRQVNGLRTALHEGLHQMRYGRTPDVADANIGWEEGATDAVARDLLGIAARKMFGHKAKKAPLRSGFYEPGQYDNEVVNIRQISTLASGAKRWNEQKARAMRRQFLHGDLAQRQAIYDRAMAAKKRRGL